MIEQFRVAEFAIEQCKGKTWVGRIGAPTTAAHRRTVRSEGVRFAVASEDPRSLELVDAIWGTDASKGTQDEEPRLVCAPVAGMAGRYVDPEGGRQLLAFDYAPFTLLKQSLRWEYGRQSVASGLMPVHGVILETAGRRVCISARGQAGKSFLADTWLEADETARVLVDDWSLVDPSTRRIRRTGDRALHVRATGFVRESAQLEGASRVLVELCDGDPGSDESRYLVDRSGLRRFENGDGRKSLDILVLIRDPRAPSFEVRDDAGAAREAFEAEAGTFWDDSLAGLPSESAAYLREAWGTLLGAIPVLVVQGHRERPAPEVVRALREALHLA